MAAKAGKDLVAEETHNTKEAAARVTVAELITIYVRRRVRGRLRTADEIEARLRRSLSDYSTVAADGIRRKDVRGLLDHVAERGALREAEKQRQLIGTMFRWAVGQDFVGSDPTSGLVGYSTGERRERVLNNDEIRALWHWAEELPPDYCAALRLQLCLGARIGEVSGLRAEEIDQNWIWTLPASRSKNKRPRLTPLVGLARQIVSERLAVFERGSLFLLKWEQL
jgi:integrase